MSPRFSVSQLGLKRWVFPQPFERTSRVQDRHCKVGSACGRGGSGAHLGGRDRLQASLPTMCKVAGDFDGIRGAAEVGVHPVDTCSRAGQRGLSALGGSLEGAL